MNFGIHPAQLDYLKNLAAGEKVIWHASMEWLFCYGKAAPPDDMAIVWRFCYPDFDLGYAFDPKTGKFDTVKDTPVAINFLSFHGRLRESNTLLASQDAAGNIPVLAILKDLENWCELRKERVAKVKLAEKDVAFWLQKARAFLEAEELVVPSRIWLALLPLQKQ